MMPSSPTNALVQHQASRTIQPLVYDPVLSSPSMPQEGYHRPPPPSPLIPPTRPTLLTPTSVPTRTSIPTPMTSVPSTSIPTPTTITSNAGRHVQAKTHAIDNSIICIDKHRSAPYAGSRAIQPVNTLHTDVLTGSWLQMIT